MKCWKCGNECNELTVTCPHCGIALSRKIPKTEIGKAMRMLYDRYGAEKILTNSAYLVNGLGDLTEESKKVRNQMKMAMDAGVGKAYLEQIALGKPDAAFDERILALLSDEAGLNDKTSKELIGYFDEMIGWRVAANAQTSGQTMKTSEKEPEIDRKKTQNDFGPEIDRKSKKEDFGPEIERKNPVEKKEHMTKTSDWKTLYFYEKAAYILLPLSMIALLVLSDKYDVLTLNEGGTLTAIYNCFRFIPLLLFIFSLLVKKSARREEANKLAGLLLIFLVIGIVFPVLDVFSRKAMLEKLNYFTEEYRIQKILYEEDIVDAIVRVPLVLSMMSHQFGKKR